jgi:hypothetical protein
MTVRLSREAFRLRPDAKAVAWRERLASRQIGRAERLLEQDLISMCATMQPSC